MTLAELIVLLDDPLGVNLEDLAAIERMPWVSEFSVDFTNIGLYWRKQPTWRAVVGGKTYGQTFPVGELGRMLSSARRRLERYAGSGPGRLSR